MLSFGPTSIFLRRKVRLQFPSLLDGWIVASSKTYLSPGPVLDTSIPQSLNIPLVPIISIKRFSAEPMLAKFMLIAVVLVILPSLKFILEPAFFWDDEIGAVGDREALDSFTPHATDHHGIRERDDVVVLR